MKIQEILTNSHHRPWKMPLEKWKFYQEWNNVIFLHWIVEEKELRKFVPQDIEIDLIDGKPWISLVAFTMENVRPRYLPSFPPISNFEEINIRTYVKYNGKSGVYFLSIEGGKKISCQIARKLSTLPYRFSKINREPNAITSINRTNDDLFELSYKVGSELANKSKLDKWLTERYALVQDSEGFINEFEIHHVEWPTFKIEFEKIRVAYPRFKKLIPGLPVLSHYSSGVQVIAWDKKSSKKLNKPKSVS